jgi:hypothetical protein
MKVIKCCGDCGWHEPESGPNMVFHQKPFCKKLSRLNIVPPRRKYIDNLDEILDDCPLEDA